MPRVVVSEAVGRRVASASGARASGVHVAMGCVRDAGDTVYVLSAAAVTARSASALAERASGLWALLPSCAAVVALLGAESDARKMADAAAKLQEAWGTRVCVLCVSKADGTLSSSGDVVVCAPLCTLFVRTTVLRAELALSADELAGGAALSPALERLLASCAVLQPTADGGPLTHPGRAVVLRSDDDELKLAVPLRAGDSGAGAGAGAGFGDGDSFAPVCVRQVSLLQDEFVVRGGGDGVGGGASSSDAPAAVAGAAVAVELVALVPVDVSGAPAGATTATVGTSLGELREGWRADLEQLLSEREQRLRADAADDGTAGDKPVVVASAGAAPTMQRTLLADRGVLFSAIDFDRGVAQDGDGDAQSRLRAEVAVACGENASAPASSKQQSERSAASGGAAASAAVAPGGRAAFADGALRLLLVLLISVAVALVAVFMTSWT